MTTTITAARSDGGASVALTVTSDQTVTTVYRSDSNGMNRVRVAPGVLPAAPGVLSIVDYEPSTSGPVYYRTDKGGDVWVEFPRGMSPRFTVPMLPAYNVAVDTVTDHQTQRASRATVHEIIDADMPVVSIGRLTSRRGTLQILATDYRTAQAVETLFARGDVVMYRQPENPGLDMYCVADRIDVSALPESRLWTISVGYVETGWPAGDRIARPGWTFDALAAEGTSFDQLPTDYRTYFDLAAGETA